MRNATLLFLVKKTDGTITDVCLAMKKRGFGLGRWNGAGGKPHTGESVEECVRRETQEEIGVVVRDVEKVGEITFRFAFTPDFDQLVHVYLSENWEGELLESEEMAPKWWKVEEIPYTSMWPDDIFWLPKVLAGEKITASFTFGEKDIILEQKVEKIDGFFLGFN